MKSSFHKLPKGAIFWTESIPDPAPYDLALVKINDGMAYSLLVKAAIEVNYQPEFFWKGEIVKNEAELEKIIQARPRA